MEINFMVTSTENSSKGFMKADEESKTVGVQGFGAKGSAHSAKALASDESPGKSAGQQSASGIVDNYDDEEELKYDSFRNMDEEEKIWEMMIEKHGRTEYNTVVEIISQYVSLV